MLQDNIGGICYSSKPRYPPCLLKDLWAQGIVAVAAVADSSRSQRFEVFHYGLCEEAASSQGEEEASKGFIEVVETRQTFH